MMHLTNTEKKKFKLKKELENDILHDGEDFDKEQFERITKKWGTVFQALADSDKE